MFTKITFRILDIVLSLFLLLTCSGLILIVGVVVYLFDGKPLLFVQKRVGLNCQIFNMFKFRTMQNKLSISSIDDEIRLTNWGRFLRRTSIDELPTLLNVLMGDMSLVGPRPMPIKYLERFSDYQLIRFEVKPGITGLAQIKGRNNLSWEERFNLDVTYVKNNSLFNDSLILISTLYVVLTGIGIKSKESEIMPEFFGKKNNKN